MALERLRRSPRTPSAVLGHVLLHPVALVALTVLVINDHVLKVVVPGALTGKLSDVAGLIVFPLLVLTLVELTRPGASRPRVLALAIVATAAAFLLVKTTDVGGAAFGWGLGAMQWAITVGPVRGAGLAPVANVVDPTDLMALPALLVSWRIAGARRVISVPTCVRTRPSAAALSVLILAGLATMATSQGAPTTSAEFEVELHLTTDAPVAVRHLDLTIAKGDDTIASAAFVASLWERIREGSNEFQDSSKARLSLIADQSAVEIPFEQGYISPALDLTALCAMGCDHGVTLVARLAPGADKADVTLNASVYASDDYREGEDQSMDSTISLIEDEAARIDGTAPNILAIASGSIEVGSDALEKRQTINLAVDGSALAGPLAFPLVGRFAVSFVVEDASGNPSAAQVTVSTLDGGDPMYLEAEVVPTDIDWLGRCQAGIDCLVPLDITVLYDPSMNAPVADDPETDPDPTESGPGFVRLAWTVEARLEAFDDRTLPSDALTLKWN